ncbi:MAG TPA: YccF family protein [Kofleriaceae bacterium]
MRTIANILWFVLGGVWMGLGWWLAGLLMVVSVVGLPWARSCFVFGSFCFSPFGREAIDRRVLTGHGDLGTGTLGFLGNVVWFLCAGLWLAIGHVAAAIASFV